jgi:hypothetical protein
MLRTAQSLPLTGLSTLGSGAGRFPPTPPACYRASWQLPGPDSHRQATTSLSNTKLHHGRYVTVSPPVLLGARKPEASAVLRGMRPARMNTSARWPGQATMRGPADGAARAQTSPPGIAARSCGMWNQIAFRDVREVTVHAASAWTVTPRRSPPAGRRMARTGPSQPGEGVSASRRRCADPPHTPVHQAARFPSATQVGSTQGSLHRFFTWPALWFQLTSLLSDETGDPDAAPVQQVAGRPAGNREMRRHGIVPGTEMGRPASVATRVRIVQGACPGTLRDPVGLSGSAFRSSDTVGPGKGGCGGSAERDTRSPGRDRYQAVPPWTVPAGDREPLAVRDASCPGWRGDDRLGQRHRSPTPR